MYFWLYPWLDIIFVSKLQSRNPIRRLGDCRRLVGVLHQTEDREEEALVIALPAGDGGGDPWDGGAHNPHNKS